jgi:hypothetical protein
MAQRREVEHMDVTEIQRTLDAHELRTVAVAAACDPRSVQRVLRGEPMRSSVLSRIERAIAELQRRGKLPQLADRGPR